jgi:hypothetical protein
MARPSATFHVLKESEPLARTHSIYTVAFNIVIVLEPLSMQMLVPVSNKSPTQAPSLCLKCNQSIPTNASTPCKQSNQAIQVISIIPSK